MTDERQKQQLGLVVPLRKNSSFESFPSLLNGTLDGDMLNGSGEEHDDDKLRTSLHAENDRLRAEVVTLKVKVAILQSKLKKRPNVHDSAMIQHVSTNAKRAQVKRILLDLPASLKQAASKLSFQRETSAKSHQSCLADDDVDTVEPEHDIEMHESSVGLHHRNPYLNDDSTPILTTNPDQSDDDNSFADSGKGTLSKVEESYSSDASDNGNESANLIQNRSPTPAVIIPTNDSESDESFYAEARERGGWLVGLLVLQSMSSFIIAKNQALLDDHGVIVQFLTMLVGAGGNAGNQASVRVIRGLAVGTVHNRNLKKFLRKELVMGLCLSCLIAAAGFIRSIVFAIPIPETAAITSSLLVIVITSVTIGATLPLIMKSVGIDPAHSSTTIQVIMDILGVTITVAVCKVVLQSRTQVDQLAGEG